MTDYLIKCRARVSDRCLHGKPTARQFGDDLPMDEDGTYDGDTLVCDPCYIALGTPLLADLEERIEKLRR